MSLTASDETGGERLPQFGFTGWGGGVECSHSMHVRRLRLEVNE